MTAAIGTSAVSKPRVPARSPGRDVGHGGGEREEARLHRHEGAEEGREAERAAQPAQPGRARRGDGRLVPRRRPARLGARDHDERRLRLEDQDQHGHDEPERRPAADLVPAAVGADAERDRQRRLRQRVRDLVEVDAGGRALLAPARELAVDAVQQELQLDEQHGAERGREARQREHERGQQAVAVISHVTPFGLIGVGSSARVACGDSRRM